MQVKQAEWPRDNLLQSRSLPENLAKLDLFESGISDSN